MTELIIPWTRLGPAADNHTPDIESTPVEIQRWEEDGGAVLADTTRRAQARCQCGAEYNQSDDRRAPAAFRVEWETSIKLPLTGGCWLRKR